MEHQLLTTPVGPDKEPKGRIVSGTWPTFVIAKGACRMTHQERIRIFDSQGVAYKEAFQIFLDHTDQKRNAKRWLQEVVDRLPARRVFIDAGAGNGEVTKAFASAFRRTIAIEPNVYLLNQLQQSLPTVEVLGLPIWPLNRLRRAIWYFAPIRSITFLRKSGWCTWNASYRGWRQPA